MSVVDNKPGEQDGLEGGGKCFCQTSRSTDILDKVFKRMLFVDRERAFRCHGDTSGPLPTGSLSLVISEPFQAMKWKRR